MESRTERVTGILVAPPALTPFGTLLLLGVGRRVVFEAVAHQREADVLAEGDAVTLTLSADDPFPRVVEIESYPGSGSRIVA